jgi:amphi-Trp domain-containing protein
MTPLTGEAVESEELEAAPLMGSREAADYLSALAKGLRRGEFGLTLGNRTIILAPQGKLGVVILAKRKKKKSSIDIQIAWSKPKPDPAA